MRVLYLRLPTGVCPHLIHTYRIHYVILWIVMAAGRSAKVFVCATMWERSLLKKFIILGKVAK